MLFDAPSKSKPVHQAAHETPLPPVDLRKLQEKEKSPKSCTTFQPPPKKSVTPEKSIFYFDREEGGGERKKFLWEEMQHLQIFLYFPFASDWW